MVISAYSKLGVLQNTYAPFLEMLKAPAFRIFTNAALHKVVVYDVLSQEYFFVSDSFHFDNAMFPVEGPVFQAWSFMDEASLHILEYEALPMVLNVSKEHATDLPRLHFEAIVQLKNKSLNVLHTYPLCLNDDHTSVLVCSILMDVPAAVPKHVGLQCCAYKTEGNIRELLLSRGAEVDRLHVLGLSKRELEVLYLLCKGKTSRMISEQLFVSFETIKKHRQNILEKTGCRNTVELMNLAMSLGVI